MGMLIFLGVLFILLPLLLLVLGSAAIARFYFFGEAVEGTVVGSSLRVEEDEDGHPVDRHYGSVTYMACGKSHQLDNWGPHSSPATVGASVVVRYLRKKPEKAMVWPGLQLLWLVIPLTFFIVIGTKFIEWIA